MEQTPDFSVGIVGGGVVGLALALNLHRRGVACRVYETVAEIRELGVGITLLPHAMREMTALGLGDELLSLGIENRQSAFFNRFGQQIYAEPRGKFAGYPFPEVGIHRGRLHTALYRAVQNRLGPDAVVTGRTCTGFEQDETGVTIGFAQAEPVRHDILVACDGVNSAIRKQLYPDDKVVFSGVSTWRGVTRRKPILDGRTYIRIGSIKTAKILMYPIIDDIDAEGRQLVNWAAEVPVDTLEKNDWNKQGRAEDILPVYGDWKFDWLDVGQLIRDAELILEYPMVDKDPLGRWTFGRVTLAGDAAHPMYPRGSNGAAQGTIDARTLAELLAEADDPVDALKAYEAVRLPATAAVVRTNRTQPPDFINIKVEELVGDRPFGNLDDYISQAELKALSDQYKRVAGFSLQDVR